MMEIVAAVLVWRRDFYQITFLCALVLFLCWIIIRVLRRRPRAAIFIRSWTTKRLHCWYHTDFLDKPTYCNSCMEPVLSGSYCDTCGLCVCTQDTCINNADIHQTCKPAAVVSRSCSHHWVRGNLPLASNCSKCYTPCGNEPGLADYKCAWCHRTVHEKCLVQYQLTAEECSLGPYQTLIIPPNCVSLQLIGWRGRRRLAVKELKPAVGIPNWSPLLVLANCKSGGKDGAVILRKFRNLLNPVQVVDINEVPPAQALQMCSLLPGVTWRVLVCGGDGTVGWVLAVLDEISPPLPPRVAILPLGTGNDLARVLGWGKGYDNEDIGAILSDIEHSQLSMLDRWNVSIEPQRYLGIRRSTRTLKMNNYLGVGCDAGVALNFHRQRQTRPELFTSRLLNKAWYVGYGARDVLEQSCKNLHQKIKLYLDGSEYDLPELEGVVILNINSWSAGCSIWDDSNKDGMGVSRMDDKLIEVVGMYSSLHIGTIQVSLSEPLRIGQASEVKIVLSEALPIQVDGEPWRQNPCTITIIHHSQSCLLKKVTSSI